MKIRCEIIRDILPLYAEDIVSGDTREMVEEHLKNCESCKAELNILKQPDVMSVQIGTGSLKRVESSIRRHRMFAVWVTIWTILSLFLGVSAYLKAPVFLSAEEAIQYVENREFGDVKIIWSDVVQACAGYGTEENYAHLAHTTRLDQLLAQHGYYRYGVTTEYVSYINNVMLSKSDRFMEIEDVWEDTGHDMERNHWYVNIYDGTADILLWNAGKPTPDQPIMETSYVMIVMYGLSAIFAIILALSSKIVKKTWTKELCIRFAILSIALFAGVTLSTGAQITQLACQYKFFGIVDVIIILSFVFGVTGLSYYRLYQTEKRDKG